MLDENQAPAIDDSKPFSKEGYALMGAAFEVHRHLGGGLLEEIYQESLEIELRLRGIPFQAKRELQVFYKGQLLKKRYIPDLVVFGTIIVELKALNALAVEHESQLLNYMRLARQPIGYLINFGPIGKLEWRRFILSEVLSH